MLEMSTWLGTRPAVYSGLKSMLDLLAMCFCHYTSCFILRVLDKNPGPSGTYLCYFAQSWNGASCEGTSTLNPPVLIHKVNVPVFITCRGWLSLVPRCMGTRLGLTVSRWALQEGRRHTTRKTRSLRKQYSCRYQEDGNEKEPVTNWPL